MQPATSPRTKNLRNEIIDFVFTIGGPMNKEKDEMIH